MKPRHSAKRDGWDCAGQSVVEFAMVMPLILVLMLGAVEISYAALDQHVVTRVSREASNLISRDVTLQDAALAMRDLSTRPVNLDSGSRLILSVIKKVATTGAPNYNKEVLYRRYEYGALTAHSRLTTAGTGVFGGAPHYEAANSDSDTRLQMTNLPPNLVSPGGLLYVAEIFSAHPSITPFERFGVPMPETLYSIAYF